MKNIVIGLVGILLLAGSIFFESNSKYDDTIKPNDNLVIMVEKIEYERKDNQLVKKIIDSGYNIYKDGEIEKFDKIKNTKIHYDTFSKEEIDNIISLISQIDEKAVVTINTFVAVSSGTRIIVYIDGKEITIEDFYSWNTSEAANSIKDILKSKNML